MKESVRIGSVWPWICGFCLSGYSVNIQKNIYFWVLYLLCALWDVIDTLQVTKMKKKSVFALLNLIANALGFPLGLDVCI